MQKINSLSIVALGLALALAGCSTGPEVAEGPPPPPPPMAAPTPLTDAALAEAAAAFGPQQPRPGGYNWVAPAQRPKGGAVRMVISLGRQMGWIYRGDTLVAATTVSTGVPEHPTDPGHWTILDKQRFHRSNKYSNAPMPFMQRLDHWGHALHAGVVPGYPASHGCIRLPAAVAQRLFGLTKLGESVDIEA